MEHRVEVVTLRDVRVAVEVAVWIVRAGGHTEANAGGFFAGQRLRATDGRTIVGALDPEAIVIRRARSESVDVELDREVAVGAREDLARAHDLLAGRVPRDPPGGQNRGPAVVRPRRDARPQDDAIAERISARDPVRERRRALRGRGRSGMRRRAATRERGRREPRRAGGTDSEESAPIDHGPAIPCPIAEP